MQLIVSFFDGSRRVLNLSSEFFRETEMRINRKVIVATPEEKGRDLAEYFGNRPHQVVLTNGNHIVYETTNQVNAPLIKRSFGRPESFRDDPMPGEKNLKRKKKLLRRKHKNDSFTMVIKPGLGVITEVLEAA